MSPVELMRRDLLTLEDYPPPWPIPEIERRIGRRVAKMDANENPYPASPLVHEALACCAVERYPDAHSTAFRRGLGDYLGVDPARIVCSAGGDEMLDLLMRLFLEPGDEVIDLTPSFVMYELSTRYNRGTVVPVPRVEEFAVDVDAVERAITPRTKVIFLCSPNNPTGNPTPLPDIIRVLELGPVVVLDEAYAEFAGYTHVGLSERYPNLIVLRTMSKWAALAGIRLGYAVVHPDVVSMMGKIKSPYNVSIAAQAAGLASLQDREYLMGNVRRLTAERERLAAGLRALPFGRVYPSETNFLYWTTDGVPASALRAAMAERGVLVRASSRPVEALRFSVGLPEENDLLLEVLRETHAESAN